MDHHPRHGRLDGAVQRQHAGEGGGRDPVQATGEQLFRPRSGFKQFFFDEAGDTNATSAENGDKATGAGGAGGWGAIQELTQSSPSANIGKLTLFFRCNENITGLDNTAFLSVNNVTFVEDAGDTLHQQRSDDTRANVAGVNAGFDSGWVFDVNTNYANAGAKPIRWLAQGRDASATIDAGFAGFGKNDQDNKITGVHVSDGDPSPEGILGAKLPHLFHGGWRWFWTQQHGDNVLFEVISADSVGPAGEGKRLARGRHSVRSVFHHTLRTGIAHPDSPRVNPSAPPPRPDS